ncbi:DUF6677 family protein [Paenibacillus sp. GCM10023252]|uniref:DUF6677 family protein n=1 Tax=Paenibacillus sp. GCM10023252 TaxID=3252649 RepID=UPI0036240211
MRQYGMKYNLQNRILTVLLAIIIPGAGHLYQARYLRGLLLLTLWLMDITAMIRLADANGGRHLLLIVYLGLALPVIYFISVYDALQGAGDAERRRMSAPRTNLVQGLLLMAAGGVLLLLIKPPDSLEPWMSELADYTLGPGLIAVAAAAILLTVRSRSRWSSYRLGRLTGAIIIGAVGWILLWDQLSGDNHIALLVEWWPILIILIGAEVITKQWWMAGERAASRLRFDLAGLSIAAIIAVTAYTVTQYAELPFRWLDQWNADLAGLSDYGEEKGYRYEKQPVTLTADELGSHIAIESTNGQVTVRQGTTADLQVSSVIWVDVDNQAEADSIGEKSFIHIDRKDSRLIIKGNGEPYGPNGSRKPRMNITITLPAASANPLTDEELFEGSSIPPGRSLSIQTGNGIIDVAGAQLQGGLTLEQATGDIRINDVTGEVKAETKSGQITLSRVSGAAVLATTNGSITASSITGSLSGSAANGNIELEQVSGALEAETDNGKIRITDAAGSIKADTLNGGIEISSRAIGGDWDIDSSVGEIMLSLPESGDYSIYGSVTFGTIKSDFPYTISKKTIRGKSGAGTNRIHINATNSIILQRLKEL